MVPFAVRKWHVENVCGALHGETGVHANAHAAHLWNVNFHFLVVIGIVYMHTRMMVIAWIFFVFISERLWKREYCSLGFAARWQ